MTPANFIKKRMSDWQELEQLIMKLDYKRDRSISSEEIMRFSRLYRAACTDLSLANTFRLPRETQSYLEDLVSRGHGNLYSFRRNRLADIKEFLVKKIPFMVYTDKYVRICLLAFFIPFLLCTIMAYNSKNFAGLLLGEAKLEAFYNMHSDAKKTHTIEGATIASGFYIMNNISIDLLAFGMGILGGVGSLIVTLFNAVYLGAVIGFLLSTPVRDNILSFVMAHAPFELTAIGISAGAGMRIGFAFIAPDGRRRLRALLEEARNAIPVIAGAAMLTFCAAFLEAFLGPSSLDLKYKIVIALSCTVFIIIYFGFIGYRLKKSGYEPGSGKI